MHKVSLVTSFAVLCLVSAASAQTANQPAASSSPAAPAAQTPAAPAQTSATPAPLAGEVKRVKLGALLSEGYEIKAVTLAPQEVTSRLAKVADKDGVLLTLQKGSSLATCLFSLERYATQTGLLDISWCIEQK